MSLTLLSISFPLYYLFADIFTDSTDLSYEISNTVQSQPSVKIVVEDSEFKTLRSSGRVHYRKRGYIIGYRECVNNPSEVCYIFHHDVSTYIILLWFSSELEVAILYIFCLESCNVNVCV